MKSPGLAARPPPGCKPCPGKLLSSYTLDSVEALFLIIRTLYFRLKQPDRTGHLAEDFVLMTAAEFVFTRKARDRNSCYGWLDLHNGLLVGAVHQFDNETGGSNGQTDQETLKDRIHGVTCSVLQPAEELQPAAGSACWIQWQWPGPAGERTWGRRTLQRRPDIKSRTGSLLSFSCCLLLRLFTSLIPAIYSLQQIVLRFRQKDVHQVVLGHHPLIADLKPLRLHSSLVSASFLAIAVNLDIAAIRSEPSFWIEANSSTSILPSLARDWPTFSSKEPKRWVTLLASVATCENEPDGTVGNSNATRPQLCS